METKPQGMLFEFDNAADFKSAKERFGTWPVTVWPVNHQDSLTREIKDLIGDGASFRAGSGKLGYLSTPRPPEDARRGAGQRAYLDQRRAASARAECFTKETDDESVYRGKITESIFNPAIAAWILNMYAPQTGVCFDPFAGGGTRAIMAAAHGMDYLGVELRQPEVDAVRERVKNAGFAERVKILCADSCGLNGLIPDAAADFLLTCPPYWNLEQYNGGFRDLSMLNNYGLFCDELSKVVAHTHRILKPGSVSVWVVGLHRHPDGRLAPMNHDVARLHVDAGFRFREEIVLAHQNNGAIQRVGNFDKGRKLLIRTHEYALVFDRP